MLVWPWGSLIPLFQGRLWFVEWWIWVLRWSPFVLTHVAVGPPPFVPLEKVGETILQWCDSGACVNVVYPWCCCLSLSPLLWVHLWVLAGVGVGIDLEADSDMGIAQLIPICGIPMFQACNTGHTCNGPTMDLNTIRQCLKKPTILLYPHLCKSQLCSQGGQEDNDSNCMDHLVLCRQILAGRRMKRASCWAWRLPVGWFYPVIAMGSLGQ